MNLLLFLFLCGPVAPDEIEVSKDSLQQKKETPVFYLGGIFVYAKAVRDWVIPPSTVSKELIKREHLTTVADAIKTVEGLDVTTGSKNEATITMRGFQPQQVMVLVDGRPVNNPYYGTTDLKSILTDNVVKIDVLKDVVSPIISINAMGGVVNIVTDEPFEKPSTEFMLTAGNGNTWDFNFKHGKPFMVNGDSRFYYYLGCSRESSDGFPLPGSFEPSGFDDGGLRDNSDYEKINFHGKLGYINSEKVRVGIGGGMYFSEKGVPPEEDSFARYWRFPDWDRKYADLNFQWKSLPFKVSGKFYWDNFYNRLVGYSDRDYDSTGIRWISTHNLMDYGTLIEAGFLKGKEFETKTGFMFREDIINIQDDVGADWERYTLKTGNFSISQSIDKQCVKGLLSISFPFSRNDAGIFTTAFNPQIAVTWNVNQEFSIWASSGRLTRFPNGHELYSSTSGNPDLKPEFAVKYELGTGLRKEILDLKVNLYYNDFKDLIDRASRRDTFRNIAEAYSTGGEVSVSIEPVKWVTFCGNYSYTSARDKTTWELLPGTACHKASFRIDLSTPYGERFRLKGLYVSEKFWGEDTLAPYFILDLFGEQKIGYLTIYASVTNLLDELYYEEPLLPMPGRQFRVGVGINL